MEKIVIDANFAIAQIISLPYSDKVSQVLKTWREDRVRLYAPMLWSYEVASSLRKAIAFNRIPEDDAFSRLRDVFTIKVALVKPDMQLLKSAILWAGKIKQIVAYDAQYLALSESINAKFWTADERLYKASSAAGIEWIHWVEEVT